MSQDILSRNHVRIFGSGTQPMLFAHGFGCDQNMWRLITPAFEDEYRIVLFDYVYPGYRDHVPERIRDALLERAMHDDEPVHDSATFRGTLVSRFSFAIDVNEWGLRDLRTEAITATRTLPVIQEIGVAHVWDTQEDGA